MAVDSPNFVPTSAGVWLLGFKVALTTNLNPGKQQVGVSVRVGNPCITWVRALTRESPIQKVYGSRISVHFDAYPLECIMSPLLEPLSYGPRSCAATILHCSLRHVRPLDLVTGFRQLFDDLLRRLDLACGTDNLSVAHATLPPDCDFHFGPSM